MLVLLELLNDTKTFSTNDKSEIDMPESDEKLGVFIMH